MSVSALLLALLFEFCAQQIGDSLILTLNASVFLWLFEETFNALLQFPSPTFNAFNPVK